MMYNVINQNIDLQKNDGRKILLQLLLINQNVINLGKRLPDKVSVSSGMNDPIINVDSSDPATKTQSYNTKSSSSSSSSAAAKEDRNYNDLLINAFLQEMLSYPLTYPNLFSDLKHSLDKKGVNGIISTEAKKVVGESLFIPIVNILMKVIDNLASLSGQDEDNLVKVLMDSSGGGYSNTKDLNTIMKSGGMEDIYEELSKLVENRGIDIGTLDSIRKTWINIFSSTKGRPILIDFITTILPTIESRVETSKFSSSMEDYRVEEASNVTTFLENALSEETLKNLEILAKSPYPNTVLSFFRNLAMPDSTGKMPTELTNLYYIMWWALSEENSLSALYLKSVNGKPPDPKIKPSLMFQGTLLNSHNSRNNVLTSQTNIAQFQKLNDQISENIKKPGGLTDELISHVGVIRI